jgi:hypothetical protein
MRRIALPLALCLAAALPGQTLQDVTRAGTETWQDDLPAIAASTDGSLWMAYLSFSGTRDDIAVRQLKDGVWGAMVIVPNTSGDSWLPQIGVDKDGAPWVVWSQGLDENWDIYARRYDPARQGWDKLVRLTDHPLPDVNPRLAADESGRLAVVWQGWRGPDSNIFVRMFDNGQWADAVRVSSQPANEWEPAVALDSAGTAWVAYDSYANGNYDIYLAGVKGGQLIVPEMAIADTPLFEVKPTLAVDGQDRVWVAYEEGRANWGKDTGYTIRAKEPGAVIGNERSVQMRVYANNRIQAPAQPLQTAFANVGAPGWTYQPHVFADGEDSLWAVAKIRLNLTGGNGNRGYWEYYLTRYDGSAWTAAVAIPNSWGRSSTRINAARLGDDLVLAWPTDNRTADYAHRPHKGDVYVGRLGAATSTAPNLVQPPMRKIEVKQGGHANEGADLNAIRGYRSAVHGRPVQIVRGDFHRHTELSWDGGGGNDGSLQDFYRYMIDAAAMDFGASTDHQGGAWEYWWWYTQKMTDMYHVPGAYTPIYGYERSATQPNGHRNMFFAERANAQVTPFFVHGDSQQWQLGSNPQGDIPPVGSGDLVADDTKHLYEEVRRLNGIAISHTSGTRMGTDWRDNDPELEPVVEIFQGARTNYEFEGAPLSVVTGVDDAHARQAGYFPEGFVRLAWNKGYRLGIITSSDHGSTHYSYAMVYTDRPTRQGILDAIRRRHTYGATDNIVLDVRMGENYFMGDELRASEPLPIKVKVRGTSDIDKIHIIRGDKVLYSHAPESAEATFEYTDESARGERGTFYYYVRVEQKDGQLAWASPFWVTY